MILLAALAFLLPGALLLLGARMWLQRRDNARDDSADWLGVGGGFFDHGAANSPSQERNNG